MSEKTFSIINRQGGADYTTVSYHHKPTRAAKVKGSDTTACWGCEVFRTSGENVKRCHRHLENWQPAYKTNGACAL